MMIRTRQKTNVAGFTLIETLIAMAILAIGIFALYAMQLTSVQQNERASNITIASNWAAQQVEEIINTRYDDLLDTDGDGTDQDLDNDGLDEVGLDSTFGLNDTTVASADGSATSPDGRYVIYWNVAVELPMEGTKLVRVHVEDNSNTMRNVVTFEYYKQVQI